MDGSTQHLYVRPLTLWIEWFQVSTSGSSFPIAKLDLDQSCTSSLSSIGCCFLYCPLLKESSVVRRAGGWWRVSAYRAEPFQVLNMSPSVVVLPPTSAAMRNVCLARTVCASSVHGIASPMCRRRFHRSRRIGVSLNFSKCSVWFAASLLQPVFETVRFWADGPHPVDQGCASLRGQDCDLVQDGLPFL